ncbi:MAG TPA: hypothetical protein PKE45_08745, partial [Caldilineaceae bacterium]|nr:hypothetical protein [Caldilineaceae bacterium]
MTATTRLPSPPPDKIETASVEHGTPRADLPDDLVLWRMSVKQYHAIAGAGIINEDEPVELVEGLLVDKMTKNPPHTFATQETRIALENLLPDGWFVNIQEPITLDTSEPELDISVIRGYRRDFRRHHPGPAATMLVVEVSNATL